MPEYRYELFREKGDLLTLDSRGNLCWIMLNPSTADDQLDDPTIRRVQNFTWDLGYDRLVVVNLFGMRATDPKELRSVTPEVAVGVQNDAFIASWIEYADDIMVAWGALNNPMAKARAEHVWTQVLCQRHRERSYCLGFTKDHEPRHPLYLSKTATPLPYDRVTPSRSSV